ncbi:MAG: patatin-like phospholipase family protein [Verrucomicrobiota bacterium]
MGLALGGGFARGIAHLGVLRVLEENRIPVDLIGGVSAGSIIAAAYASGATLKEIEGVARLMRFQDVASWTLSFRGFADSRKMESFLKRLLKTQTFENMKTPLAVVATCLNVGKPVVFKDRGDVMMPVRASCSYPGLFLPIEHGDHYLVDGGIVMELPALPLREMGAGRVIAVYLPIDKSPAPPENVFGVVNRSIQVMQQHMEFQWRAHTDCVITPAVAQFRWDDFARIDDLIEAGAEAAKSALPQLREWR